MTRLDVADILEEGEDFLYMSNAKCAWKSQQTNQYLQMNSDMCLAANKQFHHPSFLSSSSKLSGALLNILHL